MKKIAIMTSGGDSPGMNGAVRAAVRTALYYNMTPYGILSGYKGMIEDNIFELKYSGACFLCVCKAFMGCR